MPKKFGTNSKSQAAWDRKEAAKVAELQRKEKEEEEANWKDDNKHVMKKQQRKPRVVGVQDDREKKKQDLLQKKQATKALLEEEMSTLKSSKPAPQPKITRADITFLKDKPAATAPKSKPAVVVQEEPLEENLNRLHLDEEQARSVTEAIQILDSGNTAMDRHPERRLKAAYQAFEDQHLEQLKKENPNLRLSQLKQMLKKEWQKSPENPLNQKFAAYNSKN